MEIYCYWMQSKWYIISSFLLPQLVTIIIILFYTNAYF